MKRVFKHIRKNILAGIFVIIPFVFSAWIVVKLFLWTDSWVYTVPPHAIAKHMVPGLGLLTFLAVTYAIGWTATFYFGRKIIGLINALMAHIPFFNKIYMAIRQILDAITNPNKKVLDKVVLVEFPKEGSYALGFITCEKCAESITAHGKNMVSVFVPKVPNPTGGFLLYLPRNKVIEIAMEAETAIKLIMSAGILNPDKRQHDVYEFSTKMREWLMKLRKIDKIGTLTDPRD
ncbi:MAG: DUF502 domain-containing protein [Chitinivibrionales bacterium]|nr:DUF502 domain-containing protein [Chitinivibrionales bacterium]